MNIDLVLMNMEPNMRIQDSAAVLDSHMALSGARYERIGNMLVREYGDLVVVSKSDNIVGVTYEGRDVRTTSELIDILCQL